LRFAITNKSDNDYDDVSVKFSPDESPVAIGQVSEIPGVSFVNNNAIAESHVTGIGPDGKPLRGRLELSLVDPEVVCAKLRAGKTLQVVMAIANGLGPDLPDNLYGPKIRARSMRIQIKLRKGQQPLSVDGTVDVQATK